MKKNPVLLALILISVVACNKKNNTDPAVTNTKDSTFHITCSIDGIKKTFTANAYANRCMHDSCSYVFIVGYPDSAETTGEQFGLGVTRTGSFGPASLLGNYTVNTTDFSIAMDYVLDMSTDTYLAGSVFDSVSTVTVTSPLKIAITSIDSIGVKGTFSGDVFKDYANAGKLTITDGDFYVKFIKIP